MLLEGKYKNSKIIVTEAEKWCLKNIPYASVIIVTDTNVNNYYSSFLEKLPRIVIPSGEKYKTRHTVEYIINSMLDLSADRNTFLLGVGGGVVTDLTGFVASVFMRGISFGLIPTSLLAQIDASIGGKTGYNFNGYKNIIGSFYLPDFVICDTSFLDTLSQEEYISGWGELIKYGFIFDEGLYRFILENTSKILGRDKDLLKDLIPQVMAIKVAVVNQDEQEKGLRKILNFGHTIGHSVEKYQSIAHGLAVNIGMMTALKLSCKINKIPNSEIATFLQLSEKLGLPTEHHFSVEQIIDAMRKDKKKQNDKIDFILLERIGKAEIKTFTYQEINRLLNELC